MIKEKKCENVAKNINSQVDAQKSCHTFGFKNVAKLWQNVAKLWHPSIFFTKSSQNLHI